MQELERLPESFEDQNAIMSQTTAKKKDAPGTSGLEAAVGMSRKWDAREAGREVAETAIKGLTRPPDFFLLFSTIHYEKRGGFQEFLNGVWDVLPKGTPLVGGTVAGFINPHGCYTRGTTAMAVSYPRIDVVVGIGKKTRKNPKKAAKELSNSLLNVQNKSPCSSPFLFCVLPGGTVPQFFGFGRKKVIKSGIVSKISLPLLDLSIRLVQMGPGREEEVFDGLAEYLPNWYILGGSSMDNLIQKRSYQFLGDEVHSTDIVGLGMISDLKCKIITTYGLKRTGIKMNITKKGLRNCVIREIDGKPATQEFLKKINWPEEFLDDRLYTKTFYYPLGYEYKGVLRPQIIGAFLGNNIACGYSIKTDDIEILSASGRSLINAMDECANAAMKNKPKMVLGVACATQLETLGSGIYQAYNKFKEYFCDIPFVIGYYAGEESYSPTSPPKQLYDSFNLSCLY
jgi:hypothetical protein